MNEKIEELEIALQYVKDRTLAIDGGANQGEWSLELAKLFDKVMAFEPHAGAFVNLAQAVRGTDNVNIIEQALGARVGSVGLHCRRKVGFTDSYVNLDGDGTQMVPLDHYRLENVGLVKLDLEGFEYFALLGAVETLKRCKPVVIIESIPKFEARFDIDESRKALRFLESLGATEVGRFPPNRIYAWV